LLEREETPRDRYSVKQFLPVFSLRGVFLCS